MVMLYYDGLWVMADVCMQEKRRLTQDHYEKEYQEVCYLQLVNFYLQ